jgi:diguanylate cyclase (GGDEF)-like protein
VDTNTTRQTYQLSGRYISLGKKLRQMLQLVNPRDVLTTRLHSTDFKNSRAEYLSIRIRTLALVFALLAPLWIPIDYMVMPHDTFLQFLVLRLAFSAAFLGLAMWGTVCTRLNAARLRITLFITIPGLFYLASHSILPDGGDNAILLGYSFLPLLVMALMTIVPLTLMEGLSYLTLIAAFYITTHLLGGSLLTLATLAQLWLLLLLGVIALWVQITQLHMLMRLYREATRDALTGLLNRRVLSTRIEEDLVHHQQTGRPMCVLLFDLDLFKRINDTHGHHTGDVVLQAFAGILQEYCQESIVAGRYGGEEFLAILPQHDLKTAKELAEQIRSACHRITVLNNDNQEVNFTTSVGVALLKAGENTEGLLARVDDGLYKAKSMGRDLVAVAD